MASWQDAIEWIYQPQLLKELQTSAMIEYVYT